MVAAVLTFTAHRGIQNCRTCSTERKHAAWVLGHPDGVRIPLGWWSQPFELSPTHAALFDDDHDHDWELAQCHAKGLLFDHGWEFPSTHGPFATLFDVDSEFRAFVFAKVEAGSLSRERLNALIATPGSFMVDLRIPWAGEELLMEYFDVKGPAADARPVEGD